MNRSFSSQFAYAILHQRHTCACVTRIPDEDLPITPSLQQWNTIEDRRLSFLTASFGITAIQNP